MVERDTAPLYTTTFVRPQEQLQDLNAFGDHEASTRIKSCKLLFSHILHAYSTARSDKIRKETNQERFVMFSRCAAQHADVCSVFRT